MPNLRQTVPFFSVTNMERSLAYYRDGLGFAIQNQWAPEGQIRWAWLVRGGAALMLQQFDRPPQPPVGQGVSIYFLCDDALAIYRELQDRDIASEEPRVSNAMWCFGLTDPDGYSLHFESPTDTPEETRLSELPQ